MVKPMVDKIAKERLNIFLVVDTSKSMGGTRIQQVNSAIKDIKDYLINLENENSCVDFYLSIIEFSSIGKYYQNQKMINVQDLNPTDIKVGGWSNLECGYEKLEDLLIKESKGGIMPDFGGAAPIILLLTDGHPTTLKYKDELEKLKKIPWFKVALRYGIAIELNDKRTIGVLKEFVGSAGDVIECYEASILKNIIKIIVLTASKVKSTSSNVTYSSNQFNQNTEVKQEIAQALSDVENWEW